PAVGGNIVLAVLKAVGRGDGLGVDPPAFCQPAGVQRGGGGQADRRDQHGDECVHNASFPLSRGKAAAGPAWPRARVFPPAFFAARMPQTQKRNGPSSLAALPPGCRSRRPVTHLRDTTSLAGGPGTPALPAGHSAAAARTAAARPVT